MRGSDRGCLQRRLAASILAAAAGIAASCSSTYPARQAAPSGFLSDYSQLRKGQDVLLLYVDPECDFARYDGILLDPVQICASSDGRGLAKVSREDRQRLVNYLDAVLRKNLSAEHALVDEPGPGVMRIRVAITEVKGANVVLDTVSTVLPIGLAISEIRSIATGSHTAVGSAGIECEGVDSMSGRRLLAAVDRRVGRKVTGRFDKFSEFRTAEDVFDHWANWLRIQLGGNRRTSEAGADPRPSDLPTARPSP